MRPQAFLRLLALCLALAPLAAAGRDDTQALQRENQTLRQQIQRQQAEIDALKAQLQKRPAPAPAPSASVATAASAPPPTAPPGYKLVKINPLPAAPASLPPPPPGYRLVKIQPPPPRYSDTGCHRGGFFSVGPDKPWKHEDRWLALRVGMSPAEVERLLGKEHFDISGNGRVGWEYGKCAAAYQGIVVFADGKVAYWKKPAF